MNAKCLSISGGRPVGPDEEPHCSSRLQGLGPDSVCEMHGHCQVFFWKQQKCRRFYYFYFITISYYIIRYLSLPVLIIDYYLQNIEDPSCLLVSLQSCHVEGSISQARTLAYSRWVAAKKPLQKLGGSIMGHQIGYFLDTFRGIKMQEILWMEEILHQLVTIGNYRTL